ncbi:MULTISPECIES: EAL domain-containing protein [unclassified Herbaspirillum]|uniref:putative bifunctional diguanylate cyclase/phosphodiesterase n=1 Tax=unclassified Herbaspirillum TaxID=2624150 RepID=UPI000E2F0DD7|nr:MULTISPECIES: EAL domain-containing protein [unclassified Herbaspirillum]RFB65806.1 EAL domain-containing protein [Herbaspirillum sp. 3R-3a1]TFI08888.1 EAL domain-containing protein [Herbaspirillum sp. 3R11]TFI15305.1 EAL domain-containing protein [Herbaspirillum sp. 3R-11]TFI27850.1 EAL domain-containing protein [Herbaspirillum sp. 3C11]
MAGSYNLLLICFSLFVATLASYTVLEIAERISSQETARYRRMWLAGGALVFGVGIWSTHFTGMLAFQLPINVGYNAFFTGISLLLCIGLSFYLLHRSTQRRLRWPRMLADGVALGGGMAVVHWLGLHSMQILPAVRYTPWVEILSVLATMAVAVLNIWIIYTLNARKSDHFWRRVIFAGVLGLGIFFMHCLNMAAANFSPDSVSSTYASIDRDNLMSAVVLGTLFVLIAALIFSGAQKTKLLRKIVGRTNDKLLHFATHDVLTGLPNRALLAERIQHAIHVSKRSGLSFAVLFMDLDGFKGINDSLGHSVGDGLLVAVGQRIRACIRSEDMVSRIGGDEFVAVMGNLASPEVVENLAENILSVLRQDFRVDEATLRVTSSIGIAVYPNSGDTVDALMKNADAAMYEAKQNGRNTYRFFEPAMHASAMRHLTVRHALQLAVEHNQLSLHFQPKFEGHQRTLTGVEALLRWDHPELGSMSPTEFIPIAERSGQIIPIGDWVLREVCAQIVRWDAAGMPPVKVALNLSPLQMRPDLIDSVTAIVTHAGIAPQRLMFEITETAAMKNVEKSARIITDLQELGYDIAIDDFGAGYSSLAYLQQFHCRQIKIDKFFTSRLDQGGDSGLAIVSAIIALAHALNMEVVAEGVETEAQLAALQKLNCDQVQGFLLARPAAAGDVQHFLGQGRAFA